VDVARVAVDRVERERPERGDLVRPQRRAARRDRVRHDRVVGRLVGRGGPALAVAADPGRGRQPVQQRDRRLRLRPEQGVVPAEDPALCPAGARVGDDRLERGQVPVDVVEDGDHRSRV